MFEVFKVEGFYLCNSQVLSCYSAGRTTGLVIDCGGQVCTSVALYEGFTIPHSINKSSVAGQAVTEFMVKLLKEQEGIVELANYPRNLSRLVNNIKENVGYVAKDYGAELQKAQKSNECTK